VIKENVILASGSLAIMARMIIAITKTVIVIAMPNITFKKGIMNFRLFTPNTPLKSA